MERKYLSRRAIEARIADGQTIVIVDQMVLKLDSWIQFHPGGSKAISHVVGKDCTDEVNALHSAEAKQRMKNFRIGWIKGDWANFKPPTHGGKFRHSDEQSDDSDDDEIEDEEDIALAEPSWLEAPVSSALDSSDSGTESSSSSGRDGPIIDPRLRRRRLAIDDEFSAPLTPMTSASSAPSEDEADVDPVVTAGKRLKQLEDEDQANLELEMARYPSLDRRTQQKITMQYRALDRMLRDKGYYDCNYTAYGWEVARYTAIFCLMLWLVSQGWYKTAAIPMGLFWHQIAFTAHDAGHMGITHNFVYDTIIGIFIANFCGGLSMGWWKSSHNVHHIITNEPEHDPDIQLLPFFAISNRFFKGLYSTYYGREIEYDAFASFIVRFQHLLYYPVLAFGRFNMYVLSWDHILIRAVGTKGANWWHRWMELAGMIFFWSWFGYGIIYKGIDNYFDRLAFILISHAMTMPLHVQITLSHFAMSTHTEDEHEVESFPQRMMRTTMDVVCPPWMDFVHGGLQFQAIHHLFPRIPRHNLRRTQPHVMKFCESVGIPYALYGFYEGNKQVIGHLGEIGRQAAIFRECQQFCQAEAMEGKLH